MCNSKPESDNEIFLISPSSTDPYLDIDPDFDRVWGYIWPAEALVYLYIGGVLYSSENSSSSGEVYFETGDIGPGNTLSMTDGTTTKNFTILPLEYDGVDEVNDLVYGKTVGSGTVEAYACDIGNNCGYETTIYVNESGEFYADFYLFVDIAPGSGGYLRSIDPDGDATRIGWSLPLPTFAVNPEENSAWGMHWPANTVITLSKGTDSIEKTSDEWGKIDFGNVGFDIETGDRITVSDTTTSKTLDVFLLDFTSADEVNELIHGIAELNSEVNVRACDPNCTELTVTAVGLGNFTANFAGYVDIAPGSNGSIWRYDNDGDSTEIFWRIPNPRFSVNYVMNYVWGTEWIPGSTVPLNVEGSDVASATVEDNGNLFIDTSSLDIQPGYTVTLSDGSTIKTLEVQTLTVTAVDPDTDTISGTADEDSEVIVDTDNGRSIVTTWAGEFDTWSADFTDQTDIVKGSYGFARRIDDDGDWTESYWRIPNPSFAVNPVDDSVWGWEWPALTELTLTAKGNTYQAYTDEYRDVDFGRPGPDLVAGDILTLSDGVTIKTHTVYYLAYTGYDLAADTISGTADEGSPVHVWACDNSHCVGVDPVVPSSGEWVADFFGQMDLVQGTGGGMQIVDDDNDDTRIDWRIPDPQIRVYPNAGMQFIQGSEWLPNTDIDLTVNSENYGSTGSDENGEVSFTDLLFEIVPGMVVEMTDGQSTRTHTVIDITFTDIDEEYDTVSGTADPGEVQAYACDLENGCQFVYPTANGSRNWTADFNDLVDIASGSDGGAHQYDAQGNSTRVYWSISYPYLIIFPEKDLVEGYQWMPGVEVSLDIIGTSSFHDSKAAADDGSVVFNLLSIFDIQPGQEVVMSDGVSTKNHVVRDIAVTEFDDVEDHVIGTADAGSTVFVAAFNDAPWGSTTHVTADEAGIWVADFSGYEDIKLGTYGFMEQEERRSGQHPYRLLVWK